ncbi:MAG: hypothetical protein JRG94_19420 [Deltaproteobacteria bacterium]|nr:hypothetical protein [Deltaproteobacteria bacterium]
MQRVGRTSLGSANVLAILLAVWFSACAADRETAILPPILTEKVPDAQAVGSLACEDCHDKEPEFYRAGAHKLAFFRDAINAGCESCHGAGSVHSDYFYENDDYEDDPHDLVSSDDLRAMSESQRSFHSGPPPTTPVPTWVAGIAIPRTSTPRNRGRSK